MTKRYDDHVTRKLEMTNKLRDLTKGKVKWDVMWRNVTGVTRRFGKWEVI